MNHDACSSQTTWQNTGLDLSNECWWKKFRAPTGLWFNQFSDFIQIFPGSSPNRSTTTNNCLQWLHSGCLGWKMTIRWFLWCGTCTLANVRRWTRRYPFWLTVTSLSWFNLIWRVRRATRGRVHRVISWISVKSIGKPGRPRWGRGWGHNDFMVLWSLVNMFHALWRWIRMLRQTPTAGRSGRWGPRCRRGSGIGGRLRGAAPSAFDLKGFRFISFTSRAAKRSCTACRCVVEPLTNFQCYLVLQKIVFATRIPPCSACFSAP